MKLSEHLFKQIESVARTFKPYSVNINWRKFEFLKVRLHSQLPMGSEYNEAVGTPIRTDGESVVKEKR